MKPVQLHHTGGTPFIGLTIKSPTDVRRVIRHVGERLASQQRQLPFAQVAAAKHEGSTTLATRSHSRNSLAVLQRGCSMEGDQLLRARMVKEA